MNSLIILLVFVSCCYCAVDFNDRPRNFSIELLYHTQKETNGHVVISPFGIWTLMTGIALGSNGKSYKQISQAFRLPKNSDVLIKGYTDLVNAVQNSASNGVSLMSKNFMFLDNDFNVKSDFKNSLQNSFGAMVQPLDFDDPRSVEIANNVIRNTGARVSNVLRSTDFQDSRMILTNVISFRGLWKLPFNESDTLVEPFYDENRQIIGNVNMMYQKAHFPFSNIQELKAFVLELPYGTDGKFSMLIFLPYAKTKITEMYKGLSVVSLKDIFKRLQEDDIKFDSEEIDVKLPRMKISTNVVMNKPLIDMGVVDIFQPGMADFSKITTEEIFISAIVHKADIEVTESGTVAEATTSATFSDRISAPSFYANRPFFYSIVEKSTLSIIFNGIYSQPSVF